jgi:hypothetical protein
VTVNDDPVFLLTAPNEPMARYWEDVLAAAGIPVLVRPGGPGAGAWGSVATFEHALYVRKSDFERAQDIITAEGEEQEAES